MPVLVCHNEMVVEWGVEWAADAKAWLVKAMIGAMDAVIKGTDEVNLAVEVEARIVRSWSEGG